MGLHGVVRRALKLMPTVVQAVALVVFIHIVGQVNKALVIIELARPWVVNVVNIAGCIVPVWERKI